jgi:hypothetical protein
MTLNDIELNAHCMTARHHASELNLYERDNRRDDLKAALKAMVKAGKDALDRLEKL